MNHNRSLPSATVIPVLAHPDVRAAVRRLTEAFGSLFQGGRDRGAQILQPPTEYPHGERQYPAADLAGHRWTFSQATADVDPADRADVDPPDRGGVR